MQVRSNGENVVQTRTPLHQRCPVGWGQRICLHLAAKGPRRGAGTGEPLSTDPEFDVSTCIASTAWTCGYLVSNLRVSQSTASTCSPVCSPICNLSATALQVEEERRLQPTQKM
jgi:hypothetical protein